MRNKDPLRTQNASASNVTAPSQSNLASKYPKSALSWLWRASRTTWGIFTQLAVILAVSYYLPRVFEHERLIIDRVDVSGKTAVLRVHDANKPLNPQWTVVIQLPGEIMSSPMSDVNSDGLADGISDTDADGIQEVVLGLGASGPKAGNVVSCDAKGDLKWSCPMGNGNPYLFHDGPVQVTQVLVTHDIQGVPKVHAAAMRPQSCFQQLAVIHVSQERQLKAEIASAVWSPGNLTLMNQLVVPGKNEGAMADLYTGVSNDWPPFAGLRLPYLGVCVALGSDSGQLPPWRGAAIRDCPNVEPLWMGYFRPNKNKATQVVEVKLLKGPWSDRIAIKLDNGVLLTLDASGVPMDDMARKWFVPITAKDVDYAKAYAFLASDRSTGAFEDHRSKGRQP